MRENLQVEEVSKAEQMVMSLQAAINQGSGPTQLSSRGAVAEDFVQISVPEYSGNVYSGDSRGTEVLSPTVMSFASLSRDVSRGGGFEKGIDGKTFSVVLVLKGKGLCMSDIGDGSSFV